MKGLINLLPSENILSSAALRALAHADQAQYHLPTAGYSIMPARAKLHELFQQVDASTKSFFRVTCADTQPLSGMHAMHLVLQGLRPSHSELFSLSRQSGGHSNTGPMASHLGYSYKPIPDWSSISDLPSHGPSRVFYLDHAVVIEPYDFSKLLTSIRPNDTLVYDISHLALFWPTYDVPRDERLLVCGSFHKSFPGPQKAFFGSIMNSDRFDEIKRFADMAVSSRHTGSMMALNVSLNEMISSAQDYRNTIKELTSACARSVEKFTPVGRTSDGEYTHSHQLWVHCPEWERVTVSAAQLGVVVYRSFLPTFNQYGLRIGLQSIGRTKKSPLAASLIGEGLGNLISGDELRAKNLFDEARSILYD